MKPTFLWSRRGLVLVGASLVLGLAVSGVFAQAPETPPALFDQVDAPVPNAAPTAWLSKSALRTRNLLVNTQLFISLPAGQTHRLRLPLFADREYIAVFTQRENVGGPFISWRGQLEGYVNGHFSAVYRDGTLLMRIYDGKGGVFSVSPQPGGGHVVEEAVAGLQGVCGVTDPQVPAPAPAKRSAPVAKSVAGKTYVDVLILYTPNARANAGGVAGIQAKAQHFINDANWMYDRSDTRVQLRLVYAEEIAYDDSAQDLSLHLDRLGDPSDGFMDDAIARRDYWGADLVCLLPHGRANSGNTLGIAYLGWWPGVVEWTMDSSTFAHEIGHNLGCHHEVANDPDGVAYAHGYTRTETWDSLGVEIAQEKRNTVMTAGFHTDLRTDYFSNPSINFTFTGNDCGFLCPNRVRPLGNAANADNARYLRENRFTTAAFQQPTYFWLSSTSGNGDATSWYPENNLPRVYSTWIPNVELDPANRAHVLLWPGNYPSAVRITRQSRLEKWGGTGNVHIGP